jgi:hypothetical protein
VHQVEDRLARLQAHAAEPKLREPLMLAVAASVSALANRPIGETVALTERAIEALPQAHPASKYSVEGQLVAALDLSEQFELLFDLSGRWLDDARRRGSLPRFISLAIVRSYCAFRAGALADAEADARDALEVARLYGHHFWLPAAVAALINPLVEHGRFDEAEAVLVDTRVEERHGHSSAMADPRAELSVRAHRAGLGEEM